VDELLKVIHHGNIAITMANSNYSQIHAIFQTAVQKPGITRFHGKLSFIDLAGNDMGGDTSSAKINKSLPSLKEHIRVLDRKGVPIQFRASKLTQVL
jgi:hypothetical protein